MLSFFIPTLPLLALPLDLLKKLENLLFIPPPGEAEEDDGGGGAPAMDDFLCSSKKASAIVFDSELFRFCGVFLALPLVVVPAEGADADFVDFDLLDFFEDDDLGLATALGWCDGGNFIRAFNLFVWSIFLISMRICSVCMLFPLFAFF